MVQIETRYVFQGANGAAALIDLFEGRRQLYVHHFMWIDATDSGCHRCTNAMDINFGPANLMHFHRSSYLLGGRTAKGMNSAPSKAGSFERTPR